MAKIEYTRINNDVNGNPRLVVHFLDLLTKEESCSSFLLWAGVKYNLALTRAKVVGGRKYHNKSYGGGIVFQGYEGCLPHAIEQAFSSFEASKVYTDAQNQIVLTVMTDSATYHNCMKFAKDMKKGLTHAPTTFATIMHECQETADSLRKRFNTRVSKDSVWLAACYVCMEMEQVITEDNQGV